MPYAKSATSKCVSEGPEDRGDPIALLGDSVQAGNESQSTEVGERLRLAVTRS